MGAQLTHRIRFGVLTAIVDGRLFNLPARHAAAAASSLAGGSAQRSRPGRIVVWEHCYEIPSGRARRPGAGAVLAFRIQTGPGTTAAGIYDFPGEYAQRFDGVDKGTSPLPGHPGPILYVGRAESGVCIHGAPDTARAGCIVITHGWPEFFRAIERTRQVSYVVEI
jgi:hypothetical protein